MNHGQSTPRIHSALPSHLLPKKQEKERYPVECYGQKKHCKFSNFKFGFRMSFKFISQKKSPVSSHIHRHRKHQILFLPLSAFLLRLWRVKPAKLVEGHRHLLLEDLFETGE